MGCNKDDVAPQMHKPAGESWDAPAGDKEGSEGHPSTGDLTEPKQPVGDAKDGGGPKEPAGDAKDGGGPKEPGKDVSPEEPKPGKPDEPPPPKADANGELPPPPEGGDIPLGAPPLPEGVKGVKLKGTVTYADFKGGLIQIDVSDRGSRNGQRGAQPKIIQLFRMEKPGPFELEVPENQGEVWLSAYNDADKNGRPSREEPRGAASGNPFKIGTQEVTGVEIKLEKEKIPPPP
jgi:hypothetical protein